MLRIAGVQFVGHADREANLATAERLVRDAAARGAKIACLPELFNTMAKWCNRQFDDLLAKARLITDQNARTKLYEEAQVVFKDQVPYTPLAHANIFQPISKRVHGYLISPLGGHRFDGITLD